MKFQDFPYKRQDVEVIIKELEQLTNSFVEAKTANEQVKVIKKLYSLQDEFMSHAVIASVRNSIDTKDEFYDNEVKYYDEKGPIINREIL